MPTIMRTIAALAVAIVASSSALAQTWPDRPIRWIVPYPAGGTSDAISRALAKRLSESLGQPVVVENKPGGDTTIGMTALVEAKNAHTIGFISDTLAVHIVGGKRTTYDPQTDLVPIIQLARIPLTFVVNAELVPDTTLPQFVARAKSDPTWLTFASVGPGSPHELGFLWFKTLGGFDATIIPYRGLAPAMQDLLGGQVKTLFWGGVASDQWVKAGKIRRLAVTTKTRLEGAPEAAPIADTYPEFEFVSWYGLAAGRDLPAAAVRRLNEELNRAIKAPEVQELYAKAGILPAGGSPDDVTALMRADIVRYQKIFRENNVKLD